MAENNESHPPAEAGAGHEGQDGGEHDKEEKKGGLEGIIGNVFREIKDFGRKALTIGAIAAMPLSFNYIAPDHLTRAAVFTSTYTAGRCTANVMQNKPALEKALKHAAISLPMSYQLAETFKGLDSLEAKIAGNYGSLAGKSAKVAAWAAIGQPAVVTSQSVLNYGLGEKFRKHWWPSVKSVFYWLAIPSSINVLAPISLFAKLAISGCLSFAFGIISASREGEGSIKNLYNAINPFAYASATYSLGTKAVKNTFSTLYSGAYGLGSAVRGIFSGAAKPKEAGAPVAHSYMKAPSVNSNESLKFPSKNIEDKLQYDKNQYGMAA